MLHIVLASGSPRRKELLEQIGIPFTILPAKGEEAITDPSPAKAVKALSLQKAAEAALQTKIPSIIIGADTIVSFENQIMGKPENKETAFLMLKKLQGKTHAVYTGVTLLKAPYSSKSGYSKIITFSERTSVTMYPMSDEEIRTYIATGEPMDKAGAYAIQGKCAAHIKKINGDYNNVVGLPLGRLCQILKNL